MDLCIKSKTLETASTRQTRKETNPAVLPRAAKCLWCLCSRRVCCCHQEDTGSCDILGTLWEEGSREACLDWVPPNLMSLQLSRCKSYTGWVFSIFVQTRAGCVYWCGMNYCTSTNENKAVLSFFKAHCRPCSLSLLILFSGNTGDFREYPVVFTQSDTKRCQFTQKRDKYSPKLPYKEWLQLCFRTGLVFFLTFFSEMSWHSSNISDQTSHQHAPGFTVRPQPAQGSSLLSGYKKPWKSIHRHKESISKRQKRCPRTIFMISV